MTRGEYSGNYQSFGAGFPELLQSKWQVLACLFSPRWWISRSCGDNKQIAMRCTSCCANMQAKSRAKIPLNLNPRTIRAERIVKSEYNGGGSPYHKNGQ